MENTIVERIALFGGTFDPIHLGHINLAVHMLETHHLDTIFFSPAFCSPHKTKNPPKASISDRVNMAKLMIEDHPSFKILDFESTKLEVSYTIDTVEYLKGKYPNSSLFLILSEDSAKHFLNWKKANEILAMATPLTGGRKSFFLKMESSLQSILKKGFTNVPVFEMSSTEIRQRLNKRLYCSHLLHHNVLNYIEKQKLYRS